MAYENIRKSALHRLKNVNACINGKRARMSGKNKRLFFFLNAAASACK